MMTKIQTSENGGVMTTYENMVAFYNFKINSYNELLLCEKGGKDLSWICNYYLSRSSNIKEHIAYRNHQTVTCFDKNLNDYTFDLIPN